jgi:hypothetical protein
MAYRPDPKELDKPLSQEDLQTYRYQLSSLAPSSVYAEYRRLHEECQLAGERLPRASSIQQLVTVWRFLRAMRKGQRPQ